MGNHILTPTTKANSDYIFISRLGQAQLKNIWTSLSNIKQDEFVELVESLNKDWKFVVIDNTTQSNNPEEFIHVVKADPPGKNIRAYIEWPKQITRPRRILWAR
jgi:hypothetical protein